MLLKARELRKVKIYFICKKFHRQKISRFEKTANFNSEEQNFAFNVVTLNLLELNFAFQQNLSFLLF